MNSSRLAKDLQRASGGSESPFMETLTSAGGFSQGYFFPVSDSAIGFFHAASCTPALSLRNVFADAGLAFTPGDTLAALDPERVRSLSGYVPDLFRAVLDDARITAPQGLPVPSPKTPIWSVMTRTFAFNPFSVSAMPDQPVSGSLVLLYPRSGGEAALVDGDVVDVFSSLNDNRASRVIYGLRDDLELPSMAYKLAEDGVGVDAIIDAGVAQDKVNSNVRAGSGMLAMFPCREIVVRDLSDVSCIAEAGIAKSSCVVLEGAQNASPIRYGFAGWSTLSSKTMPRTSGPAAVYVPEGTRVKLVTSDRRLVIRATPEEPEGKGFASSAELGPDVWRACAEDMAQLNRFRLRNLSGVSNELVDGLLKRGAAALTGVRATIESHRHNAYLLALAEALGGEVKAYTQISSVRNDMLKAVVFYLALLLPFCFFTQRLLFKSPKIEVQLLTFMALFVATFLVFRLIHPAFRVARSPETIFIAFVMGALSLFVVWILHGRFEGEMQILFRSFGGAEVSEIGYGEAGQQAMMIGVNNMKRRRIRTTLTTATIVLVTFTMLAFTSVSRKMSPTLIPVGKEAKYSVYKNSTQVAWWEKEAVTWFEGDNYAITANNDCNVELIIAFCLIIDNHKSKSHSENAVSYNIGNIGGQIKEFDPYWRAK